MLRKTTALGLAAVLTWAATGRAQTQPTVPPQPGKSPEQAAPGSVAPKPKPPDGETAEGPPPGDAPPPDYYVEPPVAPTAPPPSGPAAPGPEVRPGATEPPIVEPVPPGAVIYEPPPPPVPRHVAPKMAFWVGVRVGWFFPMGNLWFREVSDNLFRGVDWDQYASSGPLFELDIGARLGRNYNVFVLWERAQLGSGKAEADLFGGQDGGDSDFWALGVRASSDPDFVGLLMEVALGYRQFRAVWNDGTELQFTNAPLEGRIGIGADIRLNPMLSLTPLLTVGAGTFGTVDRVEPDGTTTDGTEPGDEFAGHGWLTLQVGGHFDIAGKP